jgi:hypothetical protein
MNGSAMGVVEFDSISQTGCGSRRSPMSPTNPGPCYEAGSQPAFARRRSHQWVVGLAALPFAF